MLNQGLEKILDNVEGALGAVLIGLDGLPIAEVTRKETLEISVLGAELTTLYKNALRAVTDLNFGNLQEVAVVTNSVAVISRAITNEYFLLLALSPEALIGKGRYQLRKSVDEFRKQLQ
jgi:predicted regulator of Ras-like GTPase activity (Roadblock/LC7/MglB family)